MGFPATPSDGDYHVEGGALRRYSAADGAWYRVAPTVQRATDGGALTFAMQGSAAVELTLDSDVSSLALTGWDSSLDSFQAARVSIVQDSTGGHSFDPRDVVGVWVEPTPESGALSTLPGDHVFDFEASTIDGGTTVLLRPLGLTSKAACSYMQAVELAVPAVIAGGFVTIAHDFQLVASVELIDAATRRRVLADWRQVQSAAGPVLIDFDDAHASDAYLVRVAGMAMTPCEPTVSVGRWESTELELTAAATANLTLQHTGAAGDVEVAWGDAPAVPVTSGVAVSNTYAAAFTGSVVMRWRHGVDVTLMTSTSAGWSFDIAALPKTLQTFRVTSANTLHGDIATIGPDMRVFRVLGSNVLRGDIGTLPEGMTEFRAYGFNTLHGLVSGLPTTLLDLSVLGNNVIGGDVGLIPAAGLTIFQLQGSNETFGLVSQLPASLVSYVNTGANQTEGNIDALPASLVTYNNQGANVCDGDIGGIPNTVTFFRSEGNSVATLATAFTPNAGLNLFIYRPAAGAGLGASDVDAILAAIDAIGTASGSLTLDGENAAPSAAGVTSASNLTGRGWSVTTN